MSSTKTDQPRRVVPELGSATIFTVAFHHDGKHFYSGTWDGIQRWRVADGQEVGKQTGMNLNAISVSRDHKWIVCGTTEEASVWDAELQEKVVEVEGKVYVGAVDISPDSTRFATGTGTRASIWSITTGERSVGPLEHDSAVRGIKFSPDGGRITTACKSDPSIHIFDSHNGDQLITIENPLPDWDPMVPIVWSIDGQQLFVISTAGKIRSFDTSTGSHLAEWQIHDENHLMSIALSANNKFIACSAGRSVSFWDTSTHTQLGIVEDAYNIRSLALSPDSSQLVAGNSNNVEGITIWDLSGILPETYLPINDSQRVSPESEKPQDQAEDLPKRDENQHPSESKVVDQQPDGSHSDPPELETGSRDDDDALLEVELPQKTSSPLFNYDEPPSPLAESHENPLESSVLPQDSSEAKPHGPPGPPMISSFERSNSRPNPDNAEPSGGNHRRTAGGWFRTMMKRGSHNRTAHQTPLEESPETKAPLSNRKPSTITLGKRVQRTVGRSTVRPQKKAAPKPAASTQPAKATLHSKADPATVPDQTKVESSGAQYDVVQVPEGPSSYNLTLSIPSWICCGRTR